MDAQISEKLKNIAVDNASRLNGVPAEQYALNYNIDSLKQKATDLGFTLELTSQKIILY